MIDIEKRKYDEHCEKIISSILDEYFYTEPGITLFERVTNKQLQINGVDTLFSLNGKNYTVDEKAAIRWIGLKTFSLELSFLGKNDQIKIGWLLDKNKINDYFVFVWINELNHETIQDISSIKNIDVALVSKEKILNHLYSLGWDIDKLHKKTFQIRNEENPYMGDIIKNGCKFSFSKHLKEQPINILLPKETYLELADIYKNITL
jgi:hypothetical protein